VTTLLLLPPPRCEFCDLTVDVRMEPGRTQYMRSPTPAEARWHWHHVVWLEGDHYPDRPIDVIALPLLALPDDVANRALSLCRGCADEHHANWDERWAEHDADLIASIAWH
jgi:hypothetical protein